jgi:site-specific DNA-methyltransferase (adenine-specific)
MYKILTGDCRSLLATLPPASINCVIADPPYGQTSLPWDQVVTGWAELLRRVLHPTGSMWVFGTLRHFMEHGAELKNWKLAQDIVWEKHNGTGLFNDRFRRVHEQAAQFYPNGVKWSDIWKCPQFTLDATKRTVRKKARPAHWIGATGDTTYVSEDGGPRLQRSVIYVRSMHGDAEHPTQKPEEIVEPLIRYSCPEGGIVLDPFGGSGTTALVAQKLNRHCVLIEQNLEYVAMAERRLKGS